MKKKNNFNQITLCWICEKVTDDEDEKVRDHCDVTGKFREVAHWSCKKSSIN